MLWLKLHSTTRALHHSAMEQPATRSIGCTIDRYAGAWNLGFSSAHAGVVSQEFMDTAMQCWWRGDCDGEWDFQLGAMEEEWWKEAFEQGKEAAESYKLRAGLGGMDGKGGSSSSGGKDSGGKGKGESKGGKGKGVSRSRSRSR